MSGPQWSEQEVTLVLGRHGWLSSIRHKSGLIFAILQRYGSIIKPGIISGIGESSSFRPYIGAVRDETESSLFC